MSSTTITAKRLARDFGLTRGDGFYCHFQFCQQEVEIASSIVAAASGPTKIAKRFDPIDGLNYAIDELGHAQAELAELLSSRSRASEILARRRPLTVEMIRKLFLNKLSEVQNVRRAFLVLVARDRTGSLVVFGGSSTLGLAWVGTAWA